MPTKCKITLLISSFVLLFHPLDAQQSIFPALSSQELLDSLVANYKPAIGLSYAQARDTLYGRILTKNDSLSCIYTAYSIYLDPDQDPTMAAFDRGINTEHIYPRAKGAEGETARSDMHNLFPTRVDVNADRGDLRFGEVPDAQALAWYYLDRKQSNIPGSNIAAYSELGPDRFEVREAAKGDIARAMFYFYTMYRAEAELADRDFFPLQRQILLEWHRQDPVDQAEWNRNQAIAPYQANKANPFILDCTLAIRAFAPEQSLPNCGFTPTANPSKIPGPFLLGTAFPDPFTDELQLSYELQKALEVQLLLTDALGRPVRKLIRERQLPGHYHFNFSLPELPAGLYQLQIQMRSHQQVWNSVQRIVRF